MYRRNENLKRFSHTCMSKNIVSDFGCHVKSDAGKKCNAIGHNGLSCQRGHLGIFSPCATTLSCRPSVGGGIIGLGTAETRFWHLRCPQIRALDWLRGKGFKWLGQGEQYDFLLRAENGFDLRTDTTLPERNFKCCVKLKLSAFAGRTPRAGADAPTPRRVWGANPGKIDQGRQMRR